MKINWKTLAITVAAGLFALGYIKNAEAGSVGAKIGETFKVR